jgi:hypothetical protein
MAYLGGTQEAFSMWFSLSIGVSDFERAKETPTSFKGRVLDLKNAGVKARKCKDRSSLCPINGCV